MFIEYLIYLSPMLVLAGIGLLIAAAKKTRDNNISIVYPNDSAPLHFHMPSKSEEDSPVIPDGEEISLDGGDENYKPQNNNDKAYEGEMGNESKNELVDLNSVDRETSLNWEVLQDTEPAAIEDSAHIEGFLMEERLDEGAEAEDSLNPLEEVASETTTDDVPQEANNLIEVEEQNPYEGDGSIQGADESQHRHQQKPKSHESAVALFEVVPELPEADANDFMDLDISGFISDEKTLQSNMLFPKKTEEPPTKPVYEPKDESPVAESAEENPDVPIHAVLFEEPAYRNSIQNPATFGGMRRVGEGLLTVTVNGLNFAVGSKLHRFAFYRIDGMNTGTNFVELHIIGETRGMLFMLNSSPEKAAFIEQCWKEQNKEA